MPTRTFGKEGKNTPSSFHQQSQSALFSLPAELRLKIFSLALDCPPIPLRIFDPPTGGRRLSLVTPGVGGPAVETIRAQRVLSLLVTCERAYGEAQPLLYGNNIFVVHNPEVFPILSRGVYAPWIRRLDFCWMRSWPPPSQPTSQSKMKRLGALLGGGSREKKKDMWEDVWKEIASFEGLQWIQLEISVPYNWTPEWKEREEELLTPLKAILKEGAKGELTLTWEKVGPTGKNAEEFLQGWSIKRIAWGAGSDEFPNS